jgi:hypothetical protein
VPGTVDWNGDGQVDAGDAWIEIFNGGRGAVDLGGWTLTTEGGMVYRIPAKTIVRPGRFLVLYQSETGLIFPEKGDTLRLRHPRGALVDSVTFGALEPDTSYSRDANGQWRDDWPPTPWLPNGDDAAPIIPGRPRND